MFFFIVLNSTGTSLSEGSCFPVNTKVRRAFSCPEMKKSVSVSAISAGDKQPLDENEEEENNTITLSYCPDSNGDTLSNESGPTVNGHSASNQVNFII